MYTPNSHHASPKKKKTDNVIIIRVIKPRVQEDEIQKRRFENANNLQRKILNRNVTSEKYMALQKLDTEKYYSDLNDKQQKAQKESVTRMINNGWDDLSEEEEIDDELLEAMQLQQDILKDGITSEKYMALQKLDTEKYYSDLNDKQQKAQKESVARMIAAGWDDDTVSESEE
jgi:uncharacterized hydantoinase/oxoprolinase family protein